MDRSSSARATDVGSSICRADTNLIERTPFPSTLTGNRRIVGRSVKLKEIRPRCGLASVPRPRPIRETQSHPSVDRGDRSSVNRRSTSFGGSARTGRMLRVGRGHRRGQRRPLATRSLMRAGFTTVTIDDGRGGRLERCGTGGVGRRDRRSPDRARCGASLSAGITAPRARVRPGTATPSWRWPCPPQGRWRLGRWWHPRSALGLLSRMVLGSSDVFSGLFVAPAIALGAGRSNHLGQRLQPGPGVAAPAPARASMCPSRSDPEFRSPRLVTQGPAPAQARPRRPLRQSLPADPVLLSSAPRGWWSTSRSTRSSSGCCRSPGWRR